MKKGVLRNPRPNVVSERIGHADSIGGIGRRGLILVPSPDEAGPGQLQGGARKGEIEIAKLL